MAEKGSPRDYYQIQEQVNPLRQYEGLFARAKNMITPAMVRAFSNRESVSMLALGSATGKNLNAFKGLYSHLRQRGKKASDKILLLDINQQPLEAAKAENQGEDSEKVGFARGDIRDMGKAGVQSESQDLIVSDYTLNFMPDQAGVEQAISEISRVSKVKGAVLLRFGNELAPSPQSPKSSFESPTKKGTQAGFGVLLIESRLILALAKKYNLNLESFDTEVTTDKDGNVRISYAFLLRKLPSPEAAKK